MATTRATSEEFNQSQSKVKSALESIALKTSQDKDPLTAFHLKLQYQTDANFQKAIQLFEKSTTPPSSEEMKKAEECILNKVTEIQNTVKEIREEKQEFFKTLAEKHICDDYLMQQLYVATRTQIDPTKAEELQKNLVKNFQPIHSHQAPIRKRKYKNSIKKLHFLKKKLRNSGRML